MNERRTRVTLQRSKKIENEIIIFFTTQNLIFEKNIGKICVCFTSSS